MKKPNELAELTKQRDYYKSKLQTILPLLEEAKAALVIIAQLSDGHFDLLERMDKLERIDCPLDDEPDTESIVYVISDALGIVPGKSPEELKAIRTKFERLMDDYLS